MSITVQCGNCGKGYRVGDDKAGKRMKCKECGEIVRIPAAEIFDDDFGDDDYGEELQPRRPARRPSPSVNRRSKSAGKKKPGKSSTGSFTSPKQLIIGGVMVLATVGVVVAILFSRGILGGDEKKKSAEDEKAGTNQTGSTGAPIQWQKYTHTDQSFTVDFPAGKVRSEPGRMQNGDKFQAVGVELNNTAACMIFLVTKPAFKLMSSQDKMETMNRLAKKRNVKSIHARQVDGYPGLVGFVQETQKSSILGHVMITMVDDRLYLLMAGDSDSNPQAPFVQRFIKSFHPRKTSKDSKPGQ